MADDYERQRDTAQLWKVFKTVHKMALDRGYKVAESEHSISLADFQDRFGSIPRNDLQFMFTDNDGAQMIVFSLMNPVSVSRPFARLSRLWPSVMSCGNQ